MAAAIDLVVGLVVAAVAEDQLAFAVAFETGARDGVEDAVGAVAVFGVVAAALHFHVVEVLGIDLRAHIAGDVGVGHRHAVDQPAVLVAAADVQHVVNHVGAGHVVGDEGQAVGAVGPGSVLNFGAAYQGRGRDGIGRATTGSPDTRSFSLTPAIASSKCSTGLVSDCTMTVCCAAGSLEPR